jgi:hypothetical protein
MHVAVITGGMGGLGESIATRGGSNVGRASYSNSIGLSWHVANCQATLVIGTGLPF